MTRLVTNLPASVRAGVAALHAGTTAAEVDDWIRASRERTE